MEKLNAIAARASDKIFEIGAKVRHNRAQLRMGTVLDPLNHPSHTEKKAAALKKEAERRDRAIRSANTRYENAAAAA